MVRPSTIGPFLKGTVASTDPYTVPKGSVPRSSNLLLTTRGSLTECDGTQVINAFNGTVQSGRGRFLEVFMFAPTGVQPYYLVLAQGLDQPLGFPRNLVAADGGAISSGLAAGTYFYVVTAADIFGNETVISNEVSQTVLVNHKINLTWNVVPNTYGYNIYRSATTGTETFLVQVQQPSPLTASVSYSDTGQITPGVKVPPLVDTTSQTVLFKMPPGTVLPITYNNNNIVARFPNTVIGFGFPPAGVVGAVSPPTCSRCTPSGGIAGMCSLLPQMVQFTNRVAIALGNGFAPQIYFDSTGSLVNPATILPITGVSTDANGVVTVTTSTASGFIVGTNVILSGMTDSIYNGVFVVITSSGTTFTLQNTLAIGHGSATGTVTSTTVPIFNNFIPAYPKWVASSQYSINSIVEPTAGTGNFFKAVQAGVTAGSEPIWANAPALGNEIGDGTVIWQNQGPILGSVPAPQGCGHIWVYAGSLWFLNTATVNTASGLDGPTSLRMSDANNPFSYNPVNQAFLDKDDGTEGMGLATFTISAEGIPPEGSLIAFKNYGGYQIVGVFGASFFSIQRTRSDMGCIAPRSIQFVPGFGISRMAHLGIANFDGVRDTVASEEVRPYLFPLNDPLVSDITVADATWIAGTQAALTANPPLYSTFIPIGGSGGTLTRGLVYDMVMKTWSIVDMPFSIGCVYQARPVASNPITLFGGFQDGLLHRWQGGDVQWLQGASPTYVVGSASASGTGTVVFALGFPVQVNDFIHCVWIDNNGGLGGVVPSDNLGNTYNNSASFFSDLSTYYSDASTCVVTVAGTPTITIPFPAGKAGAIAVVVIRGIPEPTNFDRDVYAGRTAGTNASTLTATMSGATTNPSDILISYAFSKGLGLTNGDGTLIVTATSSLNWMVGISYRIVAATGTYATTWSQSASTVMGVGLVARFLTVQQNSVGTDVIWSVNLPDEYNRQDPGNKLFCRRLIVRGVGAGSKTLTVTPIVNGVSKPAQSYPLPASGDFEVFAGIQRDGLRFAAKLSGSGHIEIDRAVWHIQPKQIGAKSVVA
jgi:hypothetical protein